MTDLLRLATELERSGGLHRLTALINCAVRVAWEREHPTGAGMSDRTTFGGIVHAPDSPIPDLVREPGRSPGQRIIEALHEAIRHAQGDDTGARVHVRKVPRFAAPIEEDGE